MTKKRQKYKLGEIIRLNPDSLGTNFRPEFIDYIDISSAGTGYIKETKLIKLSQASSRAKRLVKEGDTILSTVRPALRTFAYIKNPTKNTVVSTGFAVLRAKEGILDSRFLYYLISSESVTNYFAITAKGSAYPAIDKEIINKLELYIPSLSQQKGIADILSNYDNLIQNNARRIALLEKMAEQLYKEWFVRMRFPGYENTKFIKGIPENWEIRPLSKLIDDILDKRGVTPTKLGYSWVEYGIKAISALNVKGGHLVRFEDCKQVSEELYSKWMKKPLRALDILMTSEAPLGELYLLLDDKKLVLSQRLFAIRANSSKISPYYLYSYLKSATGQGVIQSKATGSTVGGIRQKLLRKVEIIVPESHLMEQFELAIKPIFQEINNLSKQIDNLRTTRDLLLPRLISGKLQIQSDRQPIVEVPEKVTPFQQKQILAYIIKKQEDKGVPTGEMVLAKNTYFIDKLFGIHTGFNWQNWHYGTYDGNIRSLINGRDGFFARKSVGDSGYKVLVLGKNRDKILDAKYQNTKIESLEDAMDDLLAIYDNFPKHRRTHLIELLNTTCKCIADIQSLQLRDIRQAFNEWKTPKAQHATKAHKFSQDETKWCIDFIRKKGWDKKLLTP